MATAYAVTAWLSIQIVATTFPYLGISDSWITGLIILLIIGFPLSIIAGWVFEITPQGLKKTDEVELTKEEVQRSEKKLNVFIISFLSLALLFLLVERIFFAESSIIERDTLSVQTASIAVLPFVDMSQEQDQEYFSDGLSEELLNVLAKVEGLQVAGRTSSFQYKGQNLDLREIGDALDVDHVLEGSIRKFGDQIRITAQLIKANDGFHLWSETYDRNYSASNLFEIQDEISHKVLQELEVRLLPEVEEELSTQLTENTEAYNLYLKATQLLVNRKAAEIEEAIGLFDQVIEKDPEFATAYARQAIAYNLLSVFGSFDRGDLIKKMRRNIDRALLLDSDLGWAYAALGIYYSAIGDTEQAEVALQKAHEKIPGDPEIMIWYANTVSDYDVYEALILRAYKTDPFSPSAIYYRALMYYEVDNFDEAFALMEKNIEINPEYSLSLSLKAEFIKDQPFGQLDQSFILIYQAYKNEPGNLNFKFELAEIALDLGFFSLVEELAEEMRTQFRENPIYLSLELDLLLYTELYEEMLNLMQLFHEFTDTSSDEIEFMEAYLILYLNSNRLAEGKDYIETSYPEIPDLAFDSGNYYLEDIAMISILYERLGETEIAEALTEITCDMAGLDSESETNFDGKIVQNLFDSMDCIALLKDKPTVITMLEDIHFKRKSKANLYSFLDGNPIYDYLKEDPEYRVLRERMEEDVDSLRENAIDWLKQNEYWQQDWEVTKTNY